MSAWGNSWLAGSWGSSWDTGGVAPEAPIDYGGGDDAAARTDFKDDEMFDIAAALIVSGALE